MAVKGRMVAILLFDDIRACPRPRFEQRIVQAVRFAVLNGRAQLPEQGLELPLVSFSYQNRLQSTNPHAHSLPYDGLVTASEIKRSAHECGFELAGVTLAEPLADDSRRYLDWVERGMAGVMAYLTDRRATVRTDPRLLLASARSIICVGKLYNGPQPRSTEFNDSEAGWVSRYAWGEDYHDVVGRGLERLVGQLPSGYDHKICVDTAPLL